MNQTGVCRCLRPFAAARNGESTGWLGVADISYDDICDRGLAPDYTATKPSHQGTCDTSSGGRCSALESLEAS